MDNSGPAFPVNKKDINDSSYKGSYKTNYQHSGMTLRDYFAGMALIGRQANPGHDKSDLVSVWCYKVADAMLIERKKGGNNAQRKRS